MKRLFIFSLLLLSSAAYAKTKNKISMVTYFPVPYVAYSQVNTTDQMDIGLTSTCDMKLGCSEESATLNATQVNLKGGKLNLDGGRGIKGYTLSLGSGNGEGKISFQNVRIQTGTMESVNAEDMKADNLNLFGKAFPSCKAANSESGGQMQWASLKLKGASLSELYLACGDIKQSTGCENTPSVLTESIPCIVGTGMQTRTWNESSCTWNEWDTSSCSVAMEYCFVDFEMESCRMEQDYTAGVSYLYKNEVSSENFVQELTDLRAPELHDTYKLSKYITAMEKRLDTGFSNHVKPSFCTDGERYKLPKVYYVREDGQEFLAWYIAWCRYDKYDAYPCQASWPAYNSLERHFFGDYCPL
ncbi:MAG: hypothetical protein J6C49_00535 [Elusimicrobiaceae bacterium]|nr:hypothetical protein [Elusimicrobiaceae bacterium]